MPIRNIIEIPLYDTKHTCVIGEGNGVQSLSIDVTGRNQRVASQPQVATRNIMPLLRFWWKINYFSTLSFECHGTLLLVAQASRDSSRVAVLEQSSAATTGVSGQQTAEQGTRNVSVVP